MFGTKLVQIGPETTVKDNLKNNHKDNHKEDHKGVLLSANFERLRGFSYA